LLPGNASAKSAPTTARRRNMATSKAHITSSCADSASQPPHCNTNQINLTKYFEVLQSIRVRCSLHKATTSGYPISLQPNLLRTMYLSAYVCHCLLKFSKQNISLYYGLPWVWSRVSNLLKQTATWIFLQRTLINWIQNQQLLPKHRSPSTTIL
jgi:hypothetical protein